MRLMASIPLILIATLGIGLVLGCSRDVPARTVIELKRSNGHHLTDPASTVRELVGRGPDGLKIEQIRNTELVELSLIDSAPAKATQEVNRLVDELINTAGETQPGLEIIIWERAQPPLVN